LQVKPVLVTDMAIGARRPLLSLLVCAVAYTTLEECFSRIASRPLPESEPTEVEAASSAPAAAAWLRAARRTAEGKKDSGAHWAAAWESTEAWWLRPVALTVSALFTLVAILQQLPGTYLRAVLSKRARGEADVGLERAGEAKLPVFQELSLTQQDRNDLRCQKCLSALQRMELPFFGTSAKWSEKDQGVLVSVNPRQPAVLEAWEAHSSMLQSMVTDALGTKALDGHSLKLHLLREGDGYAILVRFVKEKATRASFGGLSVMSLGVVYAATQWDTALRAANAEDMALVAFLSLLLVCLSELAREVTARAQQVSLDSRTFLPCPQLGLLGVFATASGSSPNKLKQLELAFSAPLTLAIASLLLGALDWNPTWTLQLHSTMGLGPVSHLHDECSVISFVACQGLLMASLALLPQSPDGRNAWAVLLGRENGEKLAETLGYIYPFLGVFAMWGGAGPAVLSLPFTWQLLLTNLTPSEQPPPVEEVSEAPMPLKCVSFTVLLLAMWMAAPLP